MEFRILGPIEAVAGDGSTVRLPRGRAQVVLAVLCAEAGREVSYDRLIDLAWNGHPPETSETQLHGLISALRRAFGADREVIVTQAHGYVLRAQVDLARMRALLAQARHSLDGGRAEEAAAGFTEAIALWRGRPFTGVDSVELAAIADAIEQEYVRALEDYAQVELRRGNPAALAQQLGAWVGAYPLREELRAGYIAALARSGRQAEAIATYHQLRVQLAEELGVDPGANLRALYQQVVSGELSAPGPSEVTPAQLPATVGDFTGRAKDVTRLLGALAGRDEQAAALVISAVSGIGGIGKSTLAVHVAHQAAAGFADGQLYANLAGTSTDPTAPAEVLARFLRDLGVPADQVPTDADELSARYRSLLAGRRILIVLDDAKDAAQVRPLLPGSSGCAVLVTSRAQLSDLAGALHVDLDELDPAEASELFARIVGHDRAFAEPEATEQILRGCAGLPLAIRIVAVKLAARPGWAIASVAARLATERDRLAQLRSGDLAVRASFRLSYDSLPPDQARAFCLLGILPSASFPLAPAAAMLGVSIAEAERVLDALCEVHLVSAPAPDQYRLHDLLRLLAVELVATELGPDERAAATERLLAWYWAAARTAAGAIAEGRPIPGFADIDPAHAAVPVPVIGDYRAGIEWFQDEEDRLVAMILLAAARQSHAEAVGLAGLFTMFTLRSGARTDHRAAFEAALSSARARDDRIAEGWLLHSLAALLAADRDYAAAITCLEQTLAIQLALGRSYAAASSVNDIATIYCEQGRYAEALAQSRRAEDMARRQPGPGYLIGICQGNQAEYLDALGQHDAALKLYDQVLAGARDGEPDRPSHAALMSQRAQTLRRLGRLREALDQHHEALALHRELGGTGPAFLDALDAYGHTLHQMNKDQEAEEAWQEANFLARNQGIRRTCSERGPLDAGPACGAVP
jgi:DNA-binding SARP family transcriptional activator